MIHLAAHLAGCGGRLDSADSLTQRMTGLSGQLGLEDDWTQRIALTQRMAGLGGWLDSADGWTQRMAGDSADGWTQQIDQPLLGPTKTQQQPMVVLAGEGLIVVVHSLSPGVFGGR